MHKPIDSFHNELNQIFIKACEDHRNGLLDEAGQAYQKLLDYFAEAPLLHYNLGLVHFGRGDYLKARDSFATAAGLQPGDADILFNLALSRKRTGDTAGAIESYRQVLAIDPAGVDALYNLAGCYKDSGRHAEAMAGYQDVLRLAPDHQAANNNLAFLYHRAGNLEQAVHHYRMVLKHNPDHQAAGHMVAALTGATATSSPDFYVKDVFDHYADHYEHSLVTELEYCVPSTIRGILDRIPSGRRTFSHGLDLGCGTGLSGQAFADLVDTLDGIDLSEKMIAVAEQKGIYRSLHAGSILDYLHMVEDTYDFYLAADVFAYVGDLEQTFCLLRQRARHNVLFCFSTETVNDVPYSLQKTGRFAHSAQYIEELAGATGWEIAGMQDTCLRKEKGTWVKGTLWFLQLV